MRLRKQKAFVETFEIEIEFESEVLDIRNPGTDCFQPEEKCIYSVFERFRRITTVMRCVDSNGFLNG